MAKIAGFFVTKNTVFQMTIDTRSYLTFYRIDFGGAGLLAG